MILLLGYNTLVDDFTPTMLANGSAASPILNNSHHQLQHDSTQLLNGQSVNANNAYASIQNNSLLSDYPHALSGTWKPGVVTDDDISGELPVQQYNAHAAPLVMFARRNNNVDSDGDINPLHSGSSSYVLCSIY